MSVDKEYIRLLNTLLESYHKETGNPAVDILKKFIKHNGWPFIYEE